MAIIKSSTDHLTINADGASKDIKFQANGVEKAVIDSSGNVGIGVVPESDWYSNFTALQTTGGSIYGDGSSTFYLGSNHVATSVNDQYINTAYANQIYMGNGINFKVAPSGTADTVISWTTAMTIDNSGGVEMVGNTSGQAFKVRHNVAGQQVAVLENDNNDGPVLKLYHPNTASQAIQHFYNANGNVGYISTSGSSTSYNTSSDYRLKENVVPMTGSIDRLKALNPSRFNFIADADTTVDGFLAHEAQEVVPEAITGTKDAMMTEEYEVTPAVMDGEDVVTEAVMGEREVEDYQGIDQSKLVPLLVSALQEAVSRIETLEAQLNA